MPPPSVAVLLAWLGIGETAKTIASATAVSTAIPTMALRKARSSGIAGGLLRSSKEPSLHTPRFRPRVTALSLARLQIGGPGTQDGYLVTRRCEHRPTGCGWYWPRRC